MQARVGQFHLGLDPPQADDPQPLGLRRDVVQQCGLADSGLTAQDEDVTFSPSQTLQQSFKSR
jgi:hypothetical protein